MVGKVARKGSKKPKQLFNKEDNMTTENQNATITISTTTPSTSSNYSAVQNHGLKMSSPLEERKGNAIKPLSLRPNRSVKKNLSLKPLGLRSR